MSEKQQVGGPVEEVPLTLRARGIPSLLDRSVTVNPILFALITGHPHPLVSVSRPVVQEGGVWRAE